MGDRGNCKQFVPNIFNPSKCQNCFKTKEAHFPPNLGNQNENRRIRQRGNSLVNVRDRNLTVKAPVKEGLLWKGTADPSDGKVQTWEESWYVLYSSGELEAFEVEDGKANKEKSCSVIVLQDFIRMLDGFTELGENHSVGFKSLKDVVYFKASTKVDFENWWKEFSTFVPSPMRRSNTVSIPNVHSHTGVTGPGNKPWLGKTYSSPGTLVLGKTSRSSSVASSASDADNTQVEFLRGQLQKLEEENKKIPKLNEEKRKLELEVNYWKEYVTNTNSLKKAGGKIDFEQELTKSKTRVVELQDELNETQKKLKYTSGKLMLQTKELNDAKASIQEANHMTSIHKATINSLKNEIKMIREGSSDLVDARNMQDSSSSGKGTPDIKRPSRADSVSDMSETNELEAKFVSLREKMKKIEKELFQKSKELEKANESRSKVAKYTRSLLQELESKLSSTQRKLSEAEEKVANTSKELEMERERRVRLESDRDDLSRSRTSSYNSFSLSANDLGALVSSPIPSPGERVDNDVNGKYADYYRSRYKETEAALFEKDKKLAETQGKLEELQGKYKSATNQFKSLDELQAKLSDATHKLSDRQLKIHELTREIESLRSFASGYERKSKELALQSERVSGLEFQIADLKQRVAQYENDSEIFRIKETVMKEQITALANYTTDDSDDEEDGDDEARLDGDDEARLERQIEIKKKVDRTIDLETTVRRLQEENKKLRERPLKDNLSTIAEKSAGVGKSTSLNDLSQLQQDKVLSKVSELQRQNSQLEQEKEKLENCLEESHRERVNLEDKLLREISELKEKQSKEIEALKISNRQEVTLHNKLKQEHLELVAVKEQHKANKEKDDVVIKQLGDLVISLKEEITRNASTINEQEKALTERDKMIQDRDSLLRERDKSYDELTHSFNDSLESARVMEEDMSKVKENANRADKERLSYERLVADLRRENQELRVKVHDGEGKQPSNVVSEDIIPIVDAVVETGADNADGETKSFLLGDQLTSLRAELEATRKSEQTLRIQLKETNENLIRSEETVIQLSGELQGYFEQEKRLTVWTEQVEGKMMRMQAQLAEAKDVMEAKAEELERERNNVIHLVEVTSAYIKELEASLTEARLKIEELQNVEKETDKAQGRRMPPEGSSEKEREGTGLDHAGAGLDGGQGSGPKQATRGLTSDIKETHKRQLDEVEEEELEELDGINAGNSKQDKDKDAIAMRKQVQDLKRQLIEQEQKHTLEVKQLSDDYRSELKAAFSGETGNMDLLNRVQDLEVELEETRVRYEEDIKHMEEKHKQEIEEMKDDLGKVLQASMSASYQPYDGSVGQDNAQELEERIIELQTEMQELKTKHTGELQMEREAHQKEMEETIRDMLMVREAFNSGRYEGVSEEGGNASSTRRVAGYVTVEELEDLKAEYEAKLREKVEEHDKELDQVRQDMATVIEAMQQGGPSETILELSTHVQELEKELEEAKVNFDLERKDMQIKLEKSESANFFGLRRNEEMGTKIYQMQREMEDMEWKHKLELQAYKDAASDANDAQSINELMRVNEELQSKLHALEGEMESNGKKHIEEMEAYALKLQEEKRSTINEMTDKVLRLESLIEDTKKRYDADISEFEFRSREERNETSKRLKAKIASLELEFEDCKKECEEEIACQLEEHEKEVAKLKLRYEKEIEELKKTSVNTSQSKKGDLQAENISLKRELKASQDKHQIELEGLHEKFRRDIALKQQDFDGQVADIRSEYEEKLKSCIKENMRRQSVSERKSDSQKVRELTRKIEDLELDIERQKKEYETEITNYKSMIEKQHSLISELRSASPLLTSPAEDKNAETKSSSLAVSRDYSKQRVQELEEQIERYEKRIDYYRDKAQRDKEDENQRVGELQAEVQGLRSAMRQLTEENPESYWGPKQLASESKAIMRRRSDNDERVNRGRDHWKRWSDVHERQEVIVSRISELDEKKNPKGSAQYKKEEVSKSGSVAQRKALWESIKFDEPSRRVQRPLSSIRP